MIRVRSILDLLIISRSLGGVKRVHNRVGPVRTQVLQLVQSLLALLDPATAMVIVAAATIRSGTVPR